MGLWAGKGGEDESRDVFHIALSINDKHKNSHAGDGG